LKLEEKIQAEIPDGGANPEEARMRRSVAISVFLLTAFPQVIQAQQQPGAKSVLTEAQREGRRVYQQKCAVCHVPVSSLARQYAPVLFRGVIAGREESIRKTIVDGSADRMPGWKYTLQAKQIDDVIDYLKTLDKPARTVSSEQDEM
jgi:mono/diheme cytochrome c family protein